jgi:NADPH:quinone reductase-like Zn-dependent oxidoreductase/SAM-dependent methyltransferase/acyl carrier protein
MFSIHSRAGGDDDAWVQHAIGGVRTGGGPAPGIAFDPEAVRARATNHITPEEFYNQRSAHAVHHGPAFQGIEALWRRDGESLGRLRLPEVCWENAADYAVHPALLDACFQVAPMAVYESAVGDDRPTIVPVGASRIRYYHRPANELWVHARLTRSSPDVIEGDLSVIDETGVALEVEGFRYQTIENRNAGADTVSRWLYRDRWVSRPLAGSPAPASPPAFLPPGSEILRDAGELVRLRAAIDDIPEASRALSATALRAVAAAFVRLGFSSRPGDPVTASGLCAELGIVERYHRLTARFLAALAGAGVLEKTGDGYRVLRPLDDLDPAPTFREILEAFPSHQSILTLVGRCGDRLDAILAGTTDPIEALFPDGATSAVEQFYQDSPEFRAYNTAVGLAIERAVRDLPQDRPLRILEVGAGTGGLTAHVLPGLPAERTHYVFSDVSVAFFSGAQQKFRNFPFVEYKPLDVERAPADQGFGEHEFDIILASDVLHATRNLRHALGNLKRLLAPEGLLLFLEAESTAPWVDVVFGVTEGWWRFEDADLRPDYPLLSGPAWHALLEDEGFRDITRLCAEPGGAPSAQVVLWARGPTVETPSSQAPSPPAAAGPWLVFADRGGVGEALAARLRGQGEPCFTVTAGPGFRRSGDAFVTDPLDPGAMNLLVAALRESGHTPTQVVHLWSLDGGPAGETTPDSLIRDETAGCHTVLELVQAAALGGGIAPPRLTLVTRFAQPLGTRGAGGFSQAGLLGLGRTIANEILDVGCTLVDLDDADPETAAGLVLAELVASDGDREVAYRSGHRFVPRIGEAGPPLAICRRVDDAPAEPAYRLTLPRPGVLDHLELAEIERRAPGENQVEIAVEAASLNFRDVLKALGLYPTDGGDHRIVGDECAGRVVRVGEGAPFRVGDPVIAVGPACLGSHVTTHAALVVRKPEALTFEEAATVPIAFMTAYYALVHLGRLQFGERVLIHSGAGGVGMAAVQIARHLGAVVYATAGTREKRALLRSLGVEHVMDSRSLTFHEEVMRLTDKRGVDVVLNSLAGQALVKGVACLAPYGRFLELGKRDIYQNSRIGLWSFRKNLSFHAVDLAGITLDRLEEARTLLEKLFALLDEGSLHPLPHRVFPVTRAGDAFRAMAQGKHTGKLVISMNPEAVPAAPRTEPPAPRFSADATYLIVGGFGGFGLTLAEWMLSRGARTLVLAGRSGATGEEARAALARLRETGARVEPLALDVADADAVDRALATLREDLPPLRGVFHTAMVLDDGILANLDRERFLRVTASKVRGAWNLHAACGLDLDHFVLFSSVSSVMGNQGQGNYAAANAFLDALAQYRRKVGLPGLSINWGHLSDVGYLARNHEVADMLDRRGIEGLRPAQAMEGLEVILSRNEPQILCARADWSRLAKVFSAVGSQRFLPLVSRYLAEEETGGDGGRIRKELARAAPEEREAIIQGYVREQVARVLGGDPANLDLERPLAELGLDSLMAVELKNRIEGDLGITLPTRDLMQEPTIEKLTPVVMSQLGVGGEVGAPVPGPGLNPGVPDLDEGMPEGLPTAPAAS